MIHQIKQGSEDWFKLRHRCVTASMIADILGVYGRAGPGHAKADFIGEGRKRLPEDGAEACAWGNQNEARALIDLGAFLDLPGKAPWGMKRELIHHRGNLYGILRGKYGASPDALYGDDTVLEVKCPYSKMPTPEAWGKKPIIEPRYWLQCQWQMFVFRRSKAILIYWDAAAGKDAISPDVDKRCRLFLIEILYDPVFLLKVILPAVEAWIADLHTHVPAPDPLQVKTYLKNIRSPIWWWSPGFTEVGLGKQAWILQQQLLLQEAAEESRKRLHSQMEAEQHLNQPQPAGPLPLPDPQEPKPAEGSVIVQPPVGQAAAAGSEPSVKPS